MKDTNKQKLRDAEYTREYILAEEINNTDFDNEMDGGNDLFFIRPAIVLQDSGQAIVVYGVFNRETGIRETEARQYAAAKSWVKALESAAKGEELPGLGPETPAGT